MGARGGREEEAGRAGNRPARPAEREPAPLRPSLVQPAAPQQAGPQQAGPQQAGPQQTAPSGPSDESRGSGTDRAAGREAGAAGEGRVGGKVRGSGGGGGSSSGGAEPRLEGVGEDAGAECRGMARAYGVRPCVSWGDAARRSDVQVRPCSGPL
jgi:hypothetical protein